MVQGQGRSGRPFDTTQRRLLRPRHRHGSRSGHGGRGRDPGSALRQQPAGHRRARHPLLRRRDPDHEGRPQPGRPVRHRRQAPRPSGRDRTGAPEAVGPHRRRRVRVGQGPTRDRRETTPAGAGRERGGHRPLAHRHRHQSSLVVRPDLPDLRSHARHLHADGRQLPDPLLPGASRYSGAGHRTGHRPEGRLRSAGPADPGQRRSPRRHGARPVRAGRPRRGLGAVWPAAGRHRLFQRHARGRGDQRALSPADRERQRPGYADGAGRPVQLCLTGGAGHLGLRAGRSHRPLRHGVHPPRGPRSRGRDLRQRPVRPTGLEHRVPHCAQGRLGALGRGPPPADPRPDDRRAQRGDGRDPRHHRPQGYRRRLGRQRGALSPDGRQCQRHDLAPGRQGRDHLHVARLQADAGFQARGTQGPTGHRPDPSRGRARRPGVLRRPDRRRSRRGGRAPAVPRSQARRPMALAGRPTDLVLRPGR